MKINSTGVSRGHLGQKHVQDSGNSFKVPTGIVCGVDLDLDDGVPVGVEVSTLGLTWNGTRASFHTARYVSNIFSMLSPEKTITKISSVSVNLETHSKNDKIMAIQKSRRRKFRMYHTIIFV